MKAVALTIAFVAIVCVVFVYITAWLDGVDPLTLTRLLLRRRL